MIIFYLITDTFKKPGRFDKLCTHEFIEIESLLTQEEVMKVKRNSQSKVQIKKAKERNLIWGARLKTYKGTIEFGNRVKSSEAKDIRASRLTGIERARKLLVAVAERETGLIHLHNL